MGVPAELVRSSKALYDAYCPGQVVAATTLDAIIGGWPGSNAGLRLLAFAVPDRSLTIRLEHAADTGFLRVACSHSVDGILTIEQAGLRPASQQITDGCATVHRVDRAWTSVVLRPHRSCLQAVRTAWTLL